MAEGGEAEVALKLAESWPGLIAFSDSTERRPGSRCSIIRALIAVNSFNMLPGTPMFPFISPLVPLSPGTDADGNN